MHLYFTNLNTHIFFCYFLYQYRRCSLFISDCHIKSCKPDGAYLFSNCCNTDQTQTSLMSEFMIICSVIKNITKIGQPYTFLSCYMGRICYLSLRNVKDIIDNCFFVCTAVSQPFWNKLEYPLAKIAYFSWEGSKTIFKTKFFKRVFAPFLYL